MRDIPDLEPYVRRLGDMVKRGREKARLTQAKLGRYTGMDERTVMNIENYKGNPVFKNLCAMIYILSLDVDELFATEENHQSPDRHEMHQLINDCSEEEVTALLPVYKEMIKALRSQNKKSI